MSEHTVSLVLQAKNETAKVFKQLTTEVEKIDKELNDLSNTASSNKKPTLLTKIGTAAQVATGQIVKTTESLKDMTKVKLNAITDGIRKIGTEAKKAEEQMGDLKDEYEDLADLGDRMAVAFAVPTAINALGAASYAEFSKSIAAVNTLLDGTIERQRDLETQVLGLAAAYGVDSTEVAEGYYNALSSGAVDASNALEFMEVALKTSIGGVTDVATAVDGLSTILNAFELSADESQRAADGLFVAMKAGKTTVGELSSYLAEAAPIANQLGVSFEELLAATATMTTTGTQTSVAFTRIRASMDAIISKKEINDVFTEMGYTSAAAAIKANGLQWTLDEIVKAADGSESALFKMLGSTEALGAALSLTGTQGAKFSEIMDDMADKTGAVDEATQAIQQTFGHEFQKTLNNMKTSFVVLGKSLETFGRVILSTINAVSSFVIYMGTEFPLISEVVMTLVASVVSLGLAFGTTLAVYGRVKAIMPIVTATFSTLATQLGLTTLAAKAASISLGAVVGWLAVIGSTYYLYRALEEAADYQKQLAELEAQAYAAAKTLELSKKMYPDAADMNIQDLKDFNDLTETQLQNMRLLLQERFKQNQLEIVSLTHKEDISKAEWERINALREENKVIISNHTTATELQRQRSAEYKTLTQEELIAEQKRVEQSIAENRRMYDARLKANDTQMVSTLDKEYQALQNSLKAITKAFDEQGNASLAQVNALGTLTDSYRNSAEAAADFKTQAEAKFNLDLGRAIDSLDLYEERLKGAYESGVIGVDEYIAESQRVATARLEIESQYQSDVRAMFLQERDARLAAINTSTEDETKKQELRRALVRETEDFIKNSYQREVDANRSARDQAYSEYLKYTDKVKALQRQLEDSERSYASTIRDLQRRNLSEFESYKDKQAEVNELVAKGEAELMAGNYELAIQYAREADSLAKSLASEVEENGKTMVSQQEAVKNATEGVTAAHNVLTGALKGQKQEAQNSADAQYALFQRLDSVLVKLNNTIAELIGNSELKITVEDNVDEAITAMGKYQAIADKNLHTKLEIEVPDSEKNKAIDGVGDAQKKAEREYGTMQVDVMSDTGDFEKSMYTIMSDDGYGAEVTVTAEDGQYWATVSDIENGAVVVTTEPQLIDSDLEAFYLSVEERIRANPPKTSIVIDPDSAQTAVDGFMEIVEMPPITAPLDVDDDPAKTTLELFQQKADSLVTESLHDVGVDNSAVEAAMRSNQRDTHSTHYINVVERHASGGAVGGMGGGSRFTRKAGFIQGAGTATSDSIPAMLSRGEYVQKAAAVRKYGVGFMQMVNSLRMPKDWAERMMGGQVPKYATGGLVGLTEKAMKSSNGSGESMELNFNFANGRTVALTGSRDAAKQLVTALREETR